MLGPILISSLLLSFAVAAGGQSRGEPIATINGAPIHESDLGIEGELISLEQQAYQIRMTALEATIADKLLSNEADRRGVSLQALLNAEVNVHVKDTSDAEVEAFYEQQKARIRRPLEEVREQIVSLLKDSQYKTAREAYVDKLRAAAEVKIALDPPRLTVDLSAAPMRGPKAAPVTIVEFSDFQCPYCRSVQPTLSAVQERYGDKIRWSFKDLPLVSIHPAAQKAAQAARCAGDQGKFWQYREELFQNTQISDDLHEQISTKLALDKSPFQSCLDTEKYKSQVAADSAEAQSFGISGTPAFVINGILLSGAQPLEAFVAVIDRELERADD
jgi:protein-disulfide isomerase